MMKHRLLYSLILLSSSALASEDGDILLRCSASGSDRVYVLQQKNGIVKRVDTEETRICKLSVKPYMFKWECKQTDKYWASVAVLNRYSGEFEVEWGDRPFGEYNAANLFASGKCIKGEVKKLF